MNDLEKILEFIEESSETCFYREDDYEIGQDNAYNNVNDYIKTLQKENSCEGCRWKDERHQKCNCCKRNKNIADLYESEV